MPGVASAFISQTAFLAAIRRIAQRLATAVRHSLASTASSTPPQLPLGDKTPRNDQELPLGDETPGTKGRASPDGERGVIDAAPASLGGRNPEEQGRDSPGGKNPGDKRRPSPAGERGNIDAAPDSLGGRNPKEQPAGERSNIGRPSFP